jgi:hypothetical protein
MRVQRTRALASLGALTSLAADAPTVGPCGDTTMSSTVSYT